MTLAPRTSVRSIFQVVRRTAFSFLQAADEALQSLHIISPVFGLRVAVLLHDTTIMCALSIRKVTQGKRSVSFLSKHHGHVYHLPILQNSEHLIAGGSKGALSQVRQANQHRLAQAERDGPGDRRDSAGQQGEAENHSECGQQARSPGSETSPIIQSQKQQTRRQQNEWDAVCHARDWRCGGTAVVRDRRGRHCGVFHVPLETGSGGPERATGRSANRQAQGRRKTPTARGQERRKETTRNEERRKEDTRSQERREEDARSQERGEESPARECRQEERDAGDQDRQRAGAKKGTQASRQPASGKTVAGPDDA